MWQWRIWEYNIRDWGDYEAHILYRWINALKHGLVDKAVDRQYSSIHRDIARGLVEPESSGVIPDGAFGE